MPRGKALTVTEKRQLVLMRELGLTSASIAEHLDVSVRTVQRASKASGAAKAALTEEVMGEARERLKSRLAADGELLELFQQHVLDDLAHSRLLRERMATALERMEARNLDEVVLVMRAAAAYSTALKNTSDVTRRSLGFDDLRKRLDDESLPELVVDVIGEGEVDELREEQRREAIELGMIDESD